jgi:cytosine/adenosine deaminase-related metal-dependent hydrolase
MDGDDWLGAARKGVTDSLAAGITCSADTTRSGAGLQAAYEAGMPALIYLEVVAVDASNLSEIVVGLLERIKSSEPVAEAGAQRLGLSPHSAYTLTSVALKACADIARQYALPLSIHLAETAGEVELVRSGSGELARVISERLSLEVIASGGSGSTPAEFLDSLGLVNNSLIAAHGVWLSEDDIVLMRQKGAAIAVCPTSNELLNVGEAPIASFVERGLTFGIGTDSIASNPSFDLFVEARKVRAICKRQGGAAAKLNSQALVEKLTIEAARALGFYDDLGSIEAGKRADFIAIDTSAKRQANPYNYLLESVNKSDITHTILGGEIVYENR